MKNILKTTEKIEIVDVMLEIYVNIQNNQDFARYGDKEVSK